MERRLDDDEADAHAHDQVRRRVAEEHRHAPANTGPGRPPRSFRVQRVRHRLARGVGVDDRPRELIGVLPARLAEHRRARSEGHRSTRHAALGGGDVHPGQVAGAAGRHRRPRPALGVLQAAAGHSGPGRAVELRPGHQHAARRGLRQHGPRAQREELLQELRPAHGHLVAHQRQDGRPRRLRRERDPLPRQPLRVRVPGEAELRRVRGERLPACWIDGDGLPRSRPRQHSVRRHHRGQRIAAQFAVRRHSDRSA